MQEDTTANNYRRAPMPVSGGEIAAPASNPIQPVQYQQPVPNAGGFAPPPATPANTLGLPSPAETIGTGVAPQGPTFMQPPAGPNIAPTYPWFLPPSNIEQVPPANFVQPGRPTPVDVYVEETRTGRFMFGVGVNSNAGVTGQVTVDERNFDILNPPRSVDDLVNGTAWRGAGQGFRLEAQPGTQVQRYLVSFTEPYLFDSNISFSSSGYYFNRGYFDWAETRLGGRLGFGYRLTPDLSVSTSLRAESVDIYGVRMPGASPELDRVVGNNELYTARATLSHDTRDIPFMPSEGHLINASYEHGFGSYTFPRAEFDWFQYYLLRERPDGSGRHTLGLSVQTGFLGDDVPIFEKYFAGGYTSLRGFSFRGASPVENGVTVGGRFQLITSAEYFFPLTADDMIKGVIFVDAGTVERDIQIIGDNIRVAPGFGFRISIPAMGPAPLAFDFAFPIMDAPGDQRQMFSFFMGFTRQ